MANYDTMLSMRMHRLTLAFDDEAVERQYLDDAAKEASRRSRVGLITGFITWAMLYVPMCWVVFPEHMGAIWKTTIYGQVPVCVLGLALTFLPNYGRASEAPRVILISALGLVSVLLVVLNPSIPHWFGFSLVLMLLLYTYFVARMRFLSTLTTAFTIAAMFLAASAHNLEVRLIFYYLFMCVGVSLFGVLSSYRTNVSGRRDWFQTREIERLLKDAHERDVQLLNAEVRRQIAERSRELSEALSRLTSSPRAQNRLTPGEIVDSRYKVVKVLGAGGMGQVFEVERVADQKSLAMKVLTGVPDREALVRFAREAQIAAQLDHPNVIAVLDVGISPSGLLFLVMQLATGSTLARERGRFGDAAWALPVLRQIANALAALHARGIVHRDLKPANILLDGDAVKLADFGIASLAEVSGDESTITRGLTQTGAIMGTPLYMAPELTRGAREATAAADVFSFGVVAHELLAGKLPYAAPPVLERLQGRALPAPPPLSQLGADLPDAIARLLDECLAENPQSRPSAETILSALG